MKLVIFRIQTPLGTFERVGAEQGNGVVDLRAAYEALLFSRYGVSRAKELAAIMFPDDMADFLGGWPVAFTAAEQALDFIAELGVPDAGSGAKLVYSEGEFGLASSIRPVRIRDYLTYEGYKLQAMKRRGLEMPELWYQVPTYTNRNHTAVAGTEEEIFWPSYSDKLDFEFEIGLVVGRAGRDISHENALDHIAGFTIYNDLSARDVQGDERVCGSGPGKSKDFDQGNIIGPCIVTPDEIDGQAIDMTLSVNGEEWARANTSAMKHSWADIIVNASRGETVHPGELIASGTMDGGCCVEQGRWFASGDLIEMRAEGIGVLRNRIVRH